MYYIVSSNRVILLHCTIIMDSCNSGSIQSSSCGDDEYDSRAHESNNNISATFLNNPSRNHVDARVGPFTTTNNHNLNPHTSPPSQQQQQNHTHMFDPSLSNYLDSIQKSPNPFLNLDMLWSKPPRSEPNITDLGGLMLPSSSSQQSQQQNQAFLLSQLAGQSQTTGVSVSALPPASSSRGGLLANDQAVSNNSGTNNSNNVRSTKKRSRASRRAPTTVLTTDTTNFRAMVQEFTGIPAPPFTSSPFPRTRLDLFGSSTTRSTFDPSPTTPPPYLLRPFAQKLQPPPSHPFQPSSSSMVENLASNNPSYNLSSSTSQADHHLGLFNMHNSILGFQGPPKYQPGNSSVLVSKTQPSLEISPGSVDSHMKMNVLEELGLSHTHTNIGALHQNMVSGTSSDGGTLMSRLNNNNNNNMRNSSTMEWAQRTVSTIADNDRGILGSPVNYRSDNIQERSVSNAKVVNYTASSSGPECAVVARGEGTVESWINCSSSD